MKFAVCNEIFESNDRETAYQFAKQTGYDGLEIAPFTLGAEPVELSLSSRHRFTQQVIDNGLEVVGLHWLLAKTEGFHLTTPDPIIQARTLEYFRKLVNLCGDLGGKIMVLGSPLQRNFASPMTKEMAMENAAKMLSKLTGELAARNVTLAIEPLGPAEGNFLNEASQAVELIDIISHPNVQLHLDVKAMSSESLPVEQIIADNRKHVVHFHANDPNRLGPGMGEYDQRPVFNALQLIKYSGWVSVEVFDFSLGYETILTRSYTAMQDAMRS